MIITTVTGRESVPGRETHVNAFFVPSTQFPGNAGPLFVKAKEPFPDKPIRAQGSAQMVAARNGFKRELVGQWTTQLFDVEEGILIKVLARAVSNGLQMSGGVLLQARSGAPLVRVTVPLSGFQDTPFSVAYVEGRFDVLTAAQAAQEGAQGLTTMDVRAFLPMNRDRLMQANVIAPETVGRVSVQRETVENTSGEKVVVTETRRRRQIQI